ncbi:hypothetical protein QQM39_06750 [Streptomyces sp. DT2A-34]|nr:hypothetical protein [Streptomyces sp. DT2A-34]MDO0910563.1 hypothetical protein [Streptomyces sp. DT2A-34]
MSKPRSTRRTTGRRPGEAWEQTKPTVLASLNLPAEAGEHLAARAALLDGTYREVAARVPANSQIVFDDDGRLHSPPWNRSPSPLPCAS